MSTESHAWFKISDLNNGVWTQSKLDNTATIIQDTTSVRKSIQNQLA